MHYTRVQILNHLNIKPHIMKVWWYNKGNFKKGRSEGVVFIVRKRVVLVLCGWEIWQKQVGPWVDFPLFEFWEFKKHIPFSAHASWLHSEQRPFAAETQPPFSLFCSFMIWFLPCFFLFSFFFFGPGCICLS